MYFGRSAVHEKQVVCLPDAIVGVSDWSGYRIIRANFVFHFYSGDQVIELPEWIGVIVSSWYGSGRNWPGIFIHILDKAMWRNPFLLDCTQFDIYFQFQASRTGWVFRLFRIEEKPVVFLFFGIFMLLAIRLLIRAGAIETALKLSILCWARVSSR